MGRHTQKAKPVQGVSLTIVRTKNKTHTKKPNSLQNYIRTTALTKKQNTTTGYINGHVNIGKGSVGKISGLNH